MDRLVSILSVVFWGALTLSALVFIHEGGHYLAARAFGVRVTEFFLGMPCRVRASFKSKKTGTVFGVTPLLLGGYTRICGMEGASDELLADALACVMRHGRVRVDVLAGELGCSEDRAYGLLATLADWAAVAPYYDPELGEKPGQSEWPAAFETLARDANGLTEYDRGHDFALAGSTAAGEPCDLGLSPAELLEQERSHTYLGCGFFKRLAMLVGGPLVNIVAAFLIVVAVLMARGVTYVSNLPTVDRVDEGGYAAAAGVQPGDAVLSVDGQTVQTWDDFDALLDERLQAGQDFSLKVERADGSEATLAVDLPDGQAVEALGVTHVRRWTYHPTFAEAAQQAVAYAGTVASTAAQIIMPQHTMEVLDQSSSIVGISVMAADAAASGVYDLALLAAAVSMSLGFMNLLPIPPLDGGKILVEAVQAVSRRTVPQRVVTWISYAGLVFFLFIFVVALKNDIFRLLIG